MPTIRLIRAPLSIINCGGPDEPEPPRLRHHLRLDAPDPEELFTDPSDHRSTAGDVY
jgi:hypothetical protein